MRPAEKIKHEMNEAKKHLRAAIEETHSTRVRQYLLRAIKEIEKAENEIVPLFEIGK